MPYAISFTRETGEEEVASFPQIELPEVSEQDGTAADDSLKFEEDIEVMEIRSERSGDDE